ncbi:glycosyltransferase family 2 protein [Mariniflexile ostreae]|uniref:Glycosyltransferase family 2 protein n=1 Tax=Mariniflexile ostreae TaxID=1520892 RepID=A0ABV5FE88_9FLAO
MTLSVVILNYNVRYFLELCLESVRAAIVDLDAEIIVIDNDSEDDSCQMVKTLFPEVVLIENKENLGFSKGNNIGVAKAKGEYLCILNPDTVVAEDAFKKLLEFVENKKNLGIVGCKLINGAGRFLPESKRNIPFVNAAFKKMLGNPNDYYAHYLDENDVGKVDVLVGAFMVMKRKLYLDIGGFDEDYFMYGEDIDLSYRVLKKGYDNYYVGNICTIHYKGESTLRNKHYAKRFYGAMQIFYKKHFKKNRVFDMLVWLGIRSVYLFRTNPVQKKKTVHQYVFVSSIMDNRLKSKLLKDVILKIELENPPPFTEVIFDANTLTFKEIIASFERHLDDESVTYKILPKQAHFILGSDNAINQGEIIQLN